MGFNYNHATVVGRLTRDPEMKKISDTVTKTYFTVAVTRNYKKADDSFETDFIPVSIWGRPGETAFQLLRKGSPVLVSGKIQIRQYEKDTTRKWLTEIVADHFQILERRPPSDPAQGITVPAIPSIVA
ncbi:single-stranded DNA-binding protein [bacterium]|nr:single-stranded DNA-binding protein [bacterium]